MNPAVSSFLQALDRWEEELSILRILLLDCGLTEEIKWGWPCYTDKGKNIAMLGAFKDYACLSFFKGALLDNTHGLLEKSGENTQSARVIKVRSKAEILSMHPLLKFLILEATALETTGEKAYFKKTSEYPVAEELTLAFAADPSFQNAFDALTPGRKNGYLLHFSSAKQSETRALRIEQCKKRIFRGLGFHDCVCGLSQRMPKCDGSHKSLG